LSSSWRSVVTGGFAAFYALSQFEAILVDGETIAKWECTDWSWYDATFEDQAFAWLVLVPLLFLFALTGLFGLWLAFAIRIRGSEHPARPHPVEWAGSA
jgi:hypothetical protein